MRLVLWQIIRLARFTEVEIVFFSDKKLCWMICSFDVFFVSDPAHRRASHMKSGASSIQRKRTERFRADVHVDATADLTTSVEGDFCSSGTYTNDAGGSGAS
jgi:hypothetical protein